ncbi:hypothetical protein ADIARSV_2655 [Arcticibacter svalbardensis MN12-7]|uniref:Uncharacterized protein n=1 Tax=Arcticibacter svalbardensis MN12-7 TaxID=1150600 RepID=R9GRM0_9SPHI|nr:hypothetical protein [Arcticibacter svalbardensis]EOR94160.1 hypothetical protein ADIARSV_2655 [Arcticibacter svalbardensis MN12-7]
MKKTLFVLFFGLLSSFFAKADDFDTLYERLFAEYLTTWVTNQSTIQGYINTQQSDGSWSTINYDSQIFIGGWEPLVYWDRLLQMALAFKKPGNSSFGDSILKVE